MSVQIKNMDDLINNLHLLPYKVIEDIDKRITDWRASGGSMEDGYIKQQFRFAENFINRQKGE